MPIYVKISSLSQTVSNCSPQTEFARGKLFLKQPKVAHGKIGRMLESYKHLVKSQKVFTGIGVHQISAAGTPIQRISELRAVSMSDGKTSR